MPRFPIRPFLMKTSNSDVRRARHPSTSGPAPGIAALSACSRPWPTVSRRLDKRPPRWLSKASLTHWLAPGGAYEPRSQTFADGLDAAVRRLASGLPGAAGRHAVAIEREPRLAAHRTHPDADRSRT